MKTITPEIIRALKMLKEHSALTDEMIADATGVKRGTVGRWSRGQTCQMGSQAWFAFAKLACDHLRGKMDEAMEKELTSIYRAPNSGRATPLGSADWPGRSTTQKEPAGEGQWVEERAMPAPYYRDMAVVSVPRGVLLPTAEDIRRFESAKASGPHFMGKTRMRRVKGGGQTVPVIDQSKQAFQEGDLVAVDVGGEVMFGRIYVVHYIIPTEPDTNAEGQETGGSEVRSTGGSTASP